MNCSLPRFCRPRAGVLAVVLALSACVSVAPIVPRIERLPEGAAGAIVPTVARPLSLAEIVDMARKATPANVIIQSLRDSRASYAINSVEAGELSRQGVPYEVVDYLRYGERQPVYAYPAYSPYAYAPYGVVPGIYFSRWSWGRYPRYRAPGISLRFGFRR